MGVAELNPRAVGRVDKVIGARIRTRRTQLGLSQHELAARIGVSFQQLQKYERGANRVSASTLLEIANALGCNVQVLFPWTQRAAPEALNDPGDLGALAHIGARLNERGRGVLIAVGRVLAQDPAFAGNAQPAAKVRASRKVLAQSKLRAESA